MPSYKAPLDDMRFILNEVLNINERLTKRVKAFEGADPETVNTMLSTAARFAEDVFFPLNQAGDREGCVFDRDTKSVRTPKGMKEAYQQFCETGLSMASCDPAYGGLGLPVTLNTAMGEMYCSANVAGAMYHGLSHGAYNALHQYGTEELKDKYLPKLVSGEWTGTMCLTEPGAGTDLGLMTTRAKKQADGSYAVTGTKIFISAGEHDLAPNILHLVLAKIDDPSTPPGIKGVSLFIVPKFLPNESGEPGERNAAFCQRLEEKMGIHANSTCEMGFEGAKGWLVGEPHKGMKAMFVMMNEARLGVGLQGLGLSEVAYQNALVYALDRTQSAEITAKQNKDGTPAKSAKIIKHPDVRRMLLTMKSQAEGARMLAYWTALQLDLSHNSPDEGEKKQAQKLLDFMTPIVKAHLTDNAETNSSDAIQVFGGHGYIKEHGMEQFYRDARITRLYEGTNGIQALDLVGRKVMMQNLLPAYLKQVAQDLAEAKKNGLGLEFVLPVAKAAFKLECATLKLQAKGLLRKTLGKDMAPTMREAGAVATDYLKLASLVAMGHMWVKMADTAQQRLGETQENRDFYETKLHTARFYMEKIMPQMYTHAAAMKTGARSLMDVAEESFGHQQTTVGEKPREVPASKSRPKPPAA